MKRFLILSVMLGVIVCGFLVSPASLKDFYFKTVGEKNTKLQTIDFGFIMEGCEQKDYKKYYDGNILVGECVTLKANKNDLNKLCDKIGLMITNKYHVENILILEGVSARIPYFIEGRQENIQLAVKENEITIASPIIYGSY